MSALFEIAVELVLNAEGGYSNHPSDPGGETYCGVSRVNWPAWAGWGWIDEQKKKGVIPWNTKFHGMKMHVKDFYRDKFWEPLLLDDVNDQSVANNIFDMSVNLGSNRAVGKVQMMLNQRWQQALKVDGKMGPGTIEVLNGLDSAKVNNSIFKLRMNHYMKNVKPEFLPGLLTRAMDFLVG